MGLKEGTARGEALQEGRTGSVQVALEGKRVEAGH